MMQGAVVQELFKKHFGERSVVGIEIGTKCADLTRAIVDIFPDCILYTVDPWEHREGAEFEAGEPQKYHDGNKELAMKRIVDDKRIIILEMKSEDALNYIPYKEVDFVWVDGDHSAEGITKDLNNYWPLVKSGGIFGGHDFLQCHPLTEIIKEFFGDKINTGDDFTFWVIK